MAQKATFQSWLKHEIVGVILQGLESKTLDDQTAAHIAKLTLDKVSKLKSAQDIKQFMTTLQPMHPGLAILATRVDELFKRKQEERKANEVLSMIKKGSAAEAIKLAKNTIM